jgi:hypothetical protein
VVELVGVRPVKEKVSHDADPDPVKIAREIWLPWFQCELADGTAIRFREYRFLPLSVNETYQFERQQSRGRGKRVTPELRAKRSAAGRKHAKVTDPHDQTKIKVAFFRRVNSGVSYSASARELVELLSDDRNPLDLENGPYYVSPDTVERIAGAG